jgi:hypothetical protein
MGGKLEIFPVQYQRPDEKLIEAATIGAAALTTAHQAEAAQPSGMQLAGRRRAAPQVGSVYSWLRFAVC